jgi:hypothetical protein
MTEARQLGLVGRVDAEPVLGSEAVRLAEILARKLGPVPRLGKRTQYELAEMGLEAACAHAASS